MSNPKYRRKRSLYKYFNTLPLQCNKQIKINFDGGDLSSDEELLLIKEFACKLDFDKHLKMKIYDR